MGAGSVVSAGARVQVRQVLLEPQARAPGLPEDTAATPYVTRTRGILIDGGEIGDEVSIMTASGRRVTGALEVVDPGDTHTFGSPPPALVEAVSAITAMRRGR